MYPTTHQQLVNSAMKHKTQNNFKEAAMDLITILESGGKFSLSDLRLFAWVYKLPVPKVLEENVPRTFEADKLKVFQELGQTYRDVINEFILPQVTDDEVESKALINLLLADINRYGMEFGGEKPFEFYKMEAKKHYDACFNDVVLKLPPDNDTRLGFCINYAKFLLKFEKLPSVAANFLKWSYKEIRILPNADQVLKACEPTLDILKSTISLVELDWEIPFIQGLNTATKLVFIINIGDYDEPGMSRVGARSDLLQLYDAFRRHNYVIFPQNCLDNMYWTKPSIMNELILFKDESCLMLADQVIIYLSGHCSSEGIQMSDMKQLSNNEVIKSMLDEKFPSMHLKPKLVINNSCRVLPQEDEEFSPPDGQQGSEIVLIESTLPGLVSYRKGNSGSCMTKAVTEVLCENEKLTFQEFAAKTEEKLGDSCTPQMEVRLVSGVCNLNYWM